MRRLVSKGIMIVFYIANLHLPLTNFLLPYVGPEQNLVLQLKDTRWRFPIRITEGIDWSRKEVRLHFSICLIDYFFMRLTAT